MTRRLSKEERRLQILTAAKKVFIEKGFAGTTTAEIAKAADISEVTLFRNFQNKQEIFMECIKPVIYTTMEETIEGSTNLVPIQKLEQILYERIQLIAKHADIIGLILREAPILQEWGEENIIEKIQAMLRGIMDEIGVSSAKQPIVMRTLLGTIISYTIMPSENDREIQAHVKSIANFIQQSIS